MTEVLATDTYRHAVWDVLVKHAEAPGHDSDRYDFCVTWPECGEYRFQGALGFGGKVWAPRLGRPARVTCYPEDRTPERIAIIERVNDLLDDLDWFMEEPAHSQSVVDGGEQ